MKHDPKQGPGIKIKSPSSDADNKTSPVEKLEGEGSENISGLENQDTKRVAAMEESEESSSEDDEPIQVLTNPNNPYNPDSWGLIIYIYIYNVINV